MLFCPKTLTATTRTSCKRMTLEKKDTPKKNCFHLRHALVSRCDASIVAPLANYGETCGRMTALLHNKEKARQVHQSTQQKLQRTKQNGTQAEGRGPGRGRGRVWKASGEHRHSYTITRSDIHIDRRTCKRVSTHNQSTIKRTDKQTNKLKTTQKSFSQLSPSLLNLSTVPCFLFC